VTRVAVLSDVHANLPALEAVLRAAEEAAVDRYAVCGDLVGYGAEPGAVLDRILELPGDVVAGNHDLAAIGRFEIGWFNPVAAEALRWTAEQLTPEHEEALERLEPRMHAKCALLVHGSVPSPADEYLLPYERERAERSFDHEPFERCFFGHTHVPSVFTRTPDGTVTGRQVEGDEHVELRPEHRYLLNPGSVGQPRDRDPRAAFLVYDDDERTVGWRRVAYDVDRAARAIRDAGLPGMLADRLAVGH
jgi:diadenosine tetraphosphatase ApaH/serine/threonine PP2A family protein phosphatase